MDWYHKKIAINRQRLDYAEHLLKKLNSQEEMLKKLEAPDFGWFAAPFTVKFSDETEFVFPNNYNYSIFHNILKSAIEVDIEKTKKELDELFEKEFNGPIGNRISV